MRWSLIDLPMRFLPWHSDTGPARRSRISPRTRLGVEGLEDRCLLAGTSFTTATVLPPAGQVDDRLDPAPLGQPAEVDYYELTLMEPGRVRLTVSPSASALDPVLTLFGLDEKVLIRSDDVSPGNPTAFLDQHLIPGTYYVTVSAGQGTGAYQIVSRFSKATSPFEDLPLGRAPALQAGGDFNGDGHLDLVSANNEADTISVLLGNGDGTFAPQQPYTVGAGPGSSLSGYFNGDGHLDLVLRSSEEFFNGAKGTISVLLGRGDGTFQDRIIMASGPDPRLTLSGHFNGDNVLDLAVTNYYPDNRISVFLGNGDGTFQDRVSYQAADGDSDGDGDVDGVLTGLLSGDFNGDLILDFVALDRNGKVSVLLGNAAAEGKGNGTFADRTSFEVGSNQVGVLSGDFNGDGRLDLATANRNGNNFSVLLGKGDGSFDLQPPMPLDANPNDLVSGDFNGDGRLDFAIANYGLNSATILLGVGNGTFTKQLAEVEPNPEGLRTADFNGDGRTDLLIVHSSAESATVLLGNGDGSFTVQPRFVVGKFPTDALRADFNGDGRTDLAVVNARGDSFSVLLGNGDGSFAAPAAFAAGHFPEALLRGDFNGDGNLDLATANSETDDVSVLLGNGDGTLSSQLRFPVGTRPGSLASGDFNGDGRLDLATANRDSDDVSVLLGNGDGTFAAQKTFGVGDFPRWLQSGDFNDDGHLDLKTLTTGTISVLLGIGDGTFAPPFDDPFGSIEPPNTELSEDFDSDGLLDRATVDDGRLAVQLRTGGGAFAEPRYFTLRPGENVLLSGDFNGDGRIDIATGNVLGDDVSVLLNTGAGTFQAPTGARALQAVPLVADFNADGAPDTAVLDRAGRILFRRGRTGQPGIFDAPLVLNPDRPARDLTSLRNDGRSALAAIDSNNDSVSLYSVAADGTVTRAALATRAAPTRVATADLNGDRIDDLVVTHALPGLVSIFLSGPAGYAESQVLDLGTGVLNSALADFDRSGSIDVVVTSQFTGDVIVLSNPGSGVLAAPQRYRAGVGLFGVQRVDADTVAGVSRVEPTSIVAGQFTGDAALDVIVTNLGIHSFTLLQGKGTGTFINPQSSTLLPQAEPTLVVSGDFNKDQNLDIAILDTKNDQVWVFRGDGLGGFVNTARLLAGSAPTGLSVFDIDRDGNLDLLVGNQFGDVLFILGNGDGSFRPFRRVDQAVSFVATQLNNDNVFDVVIANQAVDISQSAQRVAGTTNFMGQGVNFNQDGADGLQGPGSIALFDMNGDPFLDIVIANSGSNDVRVHLAKGDNLWDDGQSFFAGTNPVGVTAAQLNDDNGDFLVNDLDIMDIAVANRGSNDVSVLFGQIKAGVWSLTSGPRLDVGSEPMNVSFALRPGDLIPDMIVERSDGTIISLPGIGSGTVGTGFFDDTNPSAPFTFGSPIVTPFVAGFIATATGIFQFDRSAFTANFLFASTLLTSFTTTTINGTTAFFGGYADGSIRLIDDADLDGEFAESLIFRDAQLTDPSALQVVDNNGQTEIYATSSGQSRVFVFGLSEGVSVSSNDFGVFRDAVVQVQVSDGSQAGIALVAVIVIGERGEDALDGGDSVFIVGLSPDGTPDAATLALLTALLTGTGGEEEGDVGGSEDNGPTILDERVTLEGFIAGVEEAVRRFQQQLAPLPEGGDAPLPDWSRTLDQVFSRWAVTAHTAADLLQEPAQRSAAWLIDDGGLGRAAKPPAGGSDDDDGLRRAFAGVEWSLRNAGNSVQQVWQDTYWSLGNSLPAWPRVEAPAEMGRHDEGSPLLERDSDWQLSLASALVVAGLWPVRQTVRKQGRRRRLGVRA